VKEEIIVQGLKQNDKEVYDFVFHFYYSGLCAFAMHFLND